MSEYIEREKVIAEAEIEEYLTAGGEEVYHEYVPLSVIKSLPAADVRPVRRGKWLGTHDGFYYTYSCSECGYEALYKENTKDQVCSDFCPNCGADMMEES